MAFIEKQLSIHLKKEWFDAIKNGSKLYEIRPCTPYWAKRLSKEYDTIVFALGYPKKGDWAKIIHKTFKGCRIVDRQAICGLISIAEWEFIQKIYPDASEFFIISFK
ncbi:ASCH domain-containing protein [Helicobacter typhlonius]|uniref:ASCH domain-containing protein n=1 Tax=Helicobacter typhlonius TaxID=76936 RepID=UPI002FE04E8F